MAISLQSSMWGTHWQGRLGEHFRASQVALTRRWLPTLQEHAQARSSLVTGTDWSLSSSFHSNTMWKQGSFLPPPSTTWNLSYLQCKHCRIWWIRGKKQTGEKKVNYSSIFTTQLTGKLLVWLACLLITYHTFGFNTWIKSCTVDHHLAQSNQLNTAKLLMSWRLWGSWRLCIKLLT